MQCTRTRGTLISTNPVRYFAPYVRHKSHFDRNEKIAQDFGYTHVLFVGGCSRFICGAILLPVKNPTSTYHHLSRPIWLRYGLFHQIRIDHVLEFCLYLFLQELLKEYCLTKVECYEVKHSPQRIMWRNGCGQW